jgi:hypothetical protein
MDWDIPAASLFAVLGQPATYRTAAEARAITVIVRSDVQTEPDGLQAQARTRRVLVNARVAEIGDVTAIRRGETIETADRCYQVERVESDDGVVVVLACVQAEMERSQ